jgi:hypothetical protein
MDQQKCRVPHVQGAPNRAKTPDRLDSQMGSYVVHGHGTYGIFWDEQVVKDANFWASNIIEIISELKKTDYEGKQFPSVLYMQADNASDNKNLTMYAVCEILRDTGVFRKVKYSFLPVGHTHEDVDASFGCLSRALHDKPIDHRGTADTLTLDAMEDAWKSNWPIRKLFYAKVKVFQ